MAEEKKAYEAPVLTVHGSVESMTQHGKKKDQDNDDKKKDSYDCWSS